MVFIHRPTKQFIKLLSSSCFTGVLFIDCHCTLEGSFYNKREKMKEHRWKIKRLSWIWSKKKRNKHLGNGSFQVNICIFRKCWVHGLNWNDTHAVSYCKVVKKKRGDIMSFSWNEKKSILSVTRGSVGVTILCKMNQTISPTQSLFWRSVLCRLGTTTDRWWYC